MKVVILAGGLGTRLAEETEVRPKPMVEIGGRPIMWHIMKHYAHYGFHEFYVALGYKAEIIKRFFLEYYALERDVTVELRGGRVTLHDRGESEDWVVHLIDTGLATGTGGRLRRLAPHLGDGTFMLTYGDGVSDVDLRRLLAFHREKGRVVTLTAVRPPARWGDLTFAGDLVAEFKEKPQLHEGWISGGFMVCEPSIFDRLTDDGDSLEANGLAPLANAGQLVAYRHEAFWQCVDTLRELRLLERLWSEGRAPWKVWP